MRQLFPNNRLSLDELHLSEKEMTLFLKERSSYNGFNYIYKNGGCIDCIWLSSEGRRQYKELSKSKSEQRRKLLNCIWSFLKRVFNFLLRQVIV